MAIFAPLFSWIPHFFLLFSSISFLVIFLKTKKRTHMGSKLPPSPPKLPIIGNLHQLGKLPHFSLWELSQKHGPLMLLKLGTVPTLVVSSSEPAKQVLKTHDLNFCSRPQSPGPRKLSYNFLDVAFSPHNHQWRERRKLFVNEVLGTKTTPLLNEERDKEIDNLVGFLTTESGNLVNLDEKVYSTVDKCICTVAFGGNYGGKRFKGKKFEKVIEETMNLMEGFSCEEYFPYYGWILDILSGLNGRLKRCFKNLDDFFEMIIDEHLHPSRTNLDEHKDFVDVLIELSKNEIDKNVRVAKERIKPFLLNTFIGGIDTISVATVWAMSELAKNPRVMRKLQLELRTGLGRKPKLERNDFTSLNYLKKVIKETLRLHPPAPLLVPHETIQHCKIKCRNQEYDIYPNTRVLINAWAIARDPDAWNNPTEFYPERFDNNDIDFRGQHFEFLPFGSGRRICPAINMASTTMELLLSNLVCFFDWELPRGMNKEDLSMEEGGGLTTHRKEPLVLVPVKYARHE